MLTSTVLNKENVKNIDQSRDHSDIFSINLNKTKKLDFSEKQYTILYIWSGAYLIVCAE